MIRSFNCCTRQTTLEVRRRQLSLWLLCTRDNRRDQAWPTTMIKNSPFREHKNEFWYLKLYFDESEEYIIKYLFKGLCHVIIRYETVRWECNNPLNTIPPSPFWIRHWRYYRTIQRNANRGSDEDILLRGQRPTEGRLAGTAVDFRAKVNWRIQTT